MLQRNYIQYTWRTTLRIIHDTNWIHQMSRWIEILCQLVIPSAFFNIFFRQLIMSIDCDKIIENMDNSADIYRGYTQKMIILQVIQQIFCEMVIGGRKIVNSDIFSKLIISGQMFKIILQSFKGYFTKWCQRNPIWAKLYVTLLGMVK